MRNASDTFTSTGKNVTMPAMIVTESSPRPKMSVMMGVLLVAALYARLVGRHRDVGYLEALRRGGIDVGQVRAHGAVLTSIGRDFIRRSKWYSAKP